MHSPLIAKMDKIHRIDAGLREVTSCNSIGFSISLYPCAMYLTLAVSFGVPTFLMDKMNRLYTSLVSSGLAFRLTRFQIFL